MANPLTTTYSKPTRKVGFVLKPHGYKGHLRIEVDEDDAANDLKKGSFMLVEVYGKWVPFLVQEVNPDKTVVKLEDIDNEHQAAQLNNQPIVVFDDGSEEEDNDGWPDITGYTVTDPEKGFSAEVLGIIDMPGHSLIKAYWQYKEILIPFHEDIVMDIDEDTRTVTVDLPEGLLEINQ